MKYYIAKPRLPMEYQEVEWIESSGTQYVDTGFKPNQNTMVDADLYTSETGNRNWFGADANTTVRDYVFNAYSSNSFEYAYKHTGWEIVSTSPTTLTNRKYNVKFGQGGIFIDGTKFATLPSGSFTCIYNLFIFMRANNLGGAIGGRVYNFKIYDGTTLIRHFIPCFRKSDGAIGLYDLCGSICPLTSTPFYINSGTGAFTKGANKTELVKCDVARGVGEFSQLLHGDFQGTDHSDVTFNGNISSYAYTSAGLTIVCNPANYYSQAVRIAVSLPKDHKYLWIQNGTNFETRFYYDAISFDIINSGNGIISARNDVISIRFGPYTLNTQTTYTIKFVMVFDLTSLFGSGNEPTTYADARNRILQKYHIDIANYVPYGTQYVIERCNIFHDLPREYQRVEYIESGGTQYIDSGFTPSSQNFKIEADYMPLAVDSGGVCVLAHTNLSVQNISVCGHNNSFMWYLQNGNNFVANTSGYYTYMDSDIDMFVLGTRYKIEAIQSPTRSTLTINGKTMYRDYTPNGTLSNFYLFRRTGENEIYRLYGLKAYDNTTIVRNFIPCYRKSDNVIGLYDTIEDKFYTNQGTGTFGKGADIN